jgi:phosphoribosylformylglycinamidine (FGAM) synthase PurS component
MAEPPYVYQMLEEEERRKKEAKKKREDKAKEICDLLLANTLIPSDRYASAHLIILNSL